MLAINQSPSLHVSECLISKEIDTCKLMAFGQHSFTMTEIDSGKFIDIHNYDTARYVHDSAYLCGFRLCLELHIDGSNVQCRTNKHRSVLHLSSSIYCYIIKLSLYRAIPLLYNYPK